MGLFIICLYKIWVIKLILHRLHYAAIDSRPTVPILGSKFWVLGGLNKQESLANANVKRATAVHV